MFKLWELLMGLLNFMKTFNQFLIKKSLEICVIFTILLSNFYDKF